MQPKGDEANSSPQDSPAPRGGLKLMAVILIALALLSLYSNYEKAQLRHIEVVTIKPAPSSEASPSPSP